MLRCFLTDGCFNKKQSETETIWAGFFFSFFEPSVFVRIISSPGKHTEKRSKPALTAYRGWWWWMDALFPQVHKLHDYLGQGRDWWGVEGWGADFIALADTHMGGSAGGDVHAGEKAETSARRGALSCDVLWNMNSEKMFGCTDGDSTPDSHCRFEQRGSARRTNLSQTLMQKNAFMENGTSTVKWVR